MFELNVRDGAIWWGETRVSLKGTNWFGLETADFALHGLWCANMQKLLDFLAAQGFNALRVPFSAELALDMDGKAPGNIDYAQNPELQGLTTGQVFDRLVQECAARGILVLLDLHRLAAAQDIPELWYSSEYPEARVLLAWRTIVLRYADCWNVVGADLNNEPHGCASWGADGCGALRTDWRLAAERLAAVVLEANPRLLCFVEGVETNACCQPGEACWWGGHIAGAAQAPVRLPNPAKLVYSPHVYGPDVHAQAYFDAPSFPANLHDIWHRHFGFVVADRLGPAVCPGEWGGHCRGGSKDEAWQRAIATWFATNGIESSFYWCLNPNSGDTGGLLEDDWATPVQRKLDIIALAHPSPTAFPHDPVTPRPPAPGDAALPSPPTVDPAGAPAGPPPPAAAAAAAAAAGAPPAPPATPAGPMASGSIEVAETSSWIEGATPVVQLEARLTNTGPGPASTWKLLVGQAGQLDKAWNATQLPDEAGCWAFGPPDWVTGSGGLAPGATVAVGLIVKGAKPTDFRLG